MTALDFLPPDPGLVDRIRQGLQALKAENGMREQLAGATTAATTADRSGQPAGRQAPPAPPRRDHD